jgi:hypothetical protein
MAGGVVMKVMRGAASNTTPFISSGGYIFDKKPTRKAGRISESECQFNSGFIIVEHIQTYFPFKFVV